jgi:hypothetical protein
MIKSMEQFIKIENIVRKVFYVMVGIDIIQSIIMIFIYASRITFRGMDDISEIMRNGFFLLIVVYVFLIFNYKKSYEETGGMKRSKVLAMPFIIFGYVIVSLIVFTILGLMFAA